MPLQTRPKIIQSYFKIPVNYSDHNVIYVNLNLNKEMCKEQSQITESRDMRKVRSNPQSFLKKLYVLIGVYLQT
jgi:hypothetical protein